MAERKIKSKAANLGESGRDELNLAEFPLAVIGKRPPAGVKTLVFRDSVWDKGKGKQVERKLTVTASDLLGLPTQFDDEVLLGCIQLTKREGFKSQRLGFSRYELLKILGRPTDGRNFKRVAESLDRWAGVLVISDKAWWDKKGNCWVKDTFSVIDRVNLLDKEASGGGDRRSWLVWGDFMWQSFESGNLKQLDFEFWKSLRLATSKRLFRILDKRFWHGPTVTFDLHELAFEKLGLSRGMHTGQIKEKLKPANDELAARGVCTAKIAKKQRGKWEVEYRRKAKRAQPAEVIDSQALVELSKRGVARGKGNKLISQFGEGYILEKIALFDLDIAQGRKRGAGYLVKAIEDDYRLPKQSTATTRQPAAFVPKVHDEEPDNGFGKVIEALSASERDDFEKRFLQREGKLFRDRYEASRKESPKRFRMLQRGLFEKHRSEIEVAASLAS